MIFAVSAGSEGCRELRYSLYVPFSIAPGREISALDPSTTYDLHGYRVRLEKTVQFYALTVGPFDTQESAQRFFRLLRSAFLWASLKNALPISYPKALSEVTLFDHPKPIDPKSDWAEPLREVGWEATDGNYDAHKAVILPEAKRLPRWEMGGVRVMVGIAAASFVGRVAEALSFKAPENVVRDHKLQLAMDLYSAAFFEMSDGARFIRLVTVLEALTPGTDVSPLSQQTLDALTQRAEKEREQYPKGSDERKELDRLVGRVRELKREAIGQTLRDYILPVVKRNADLGDPAEVKRRLREVYRHRSKLLHEGRIDEHALRDGLRFLRQFVPRLLERLYVSEACGE